MNNFRANKIAGRLAAGAAAGVAGTCTMTMVLAVAKAAGLLGEPPPQKLTRRILWPLGAKRTRPHALAIATAASHLGYGVALGMLFGLMPPPRSSAAAGSLFGAAVWALSYGGWIPKSGLMPPPWADRPGRPSSMVVAHLVYGATLGGIRKHVFWGEPRREVSLLADRRG